MYGMFNNINGKIEDFKIENWNTSNVENFSMVFAGCNMKNVTLQKWDTQSATDMSLMFIKAHNTNSLSISKWDIDNVEDMESMFEDSDFNQELKWHISTETKISGMFDGTPKEGY
jgi:hypothetical protein